MKIWANLKPRQGKKINIGDNSKPRQEKISRFGLILSLSKGKNQNWG